MKSIKELAIKTTDTGLTDLLPKIILDRVERAAHPRRFARQLIRINRDLVAKKGRSITVAKTNVITAVSVGEGADIRSVTGAEGKLTWSKVTISPSKYGTYVVITQETIDGFELDVMDTQIAEAGEALANKEDKVIIDALLAGVDAGNKISVGTWSTTNAYEKIVDARTKVIEDKYNPTVMLIAPYVEGVLLKTEKFIDASRYGAREPILNGEIGLIAGLRVLTTTQQYEGCGLVVEPGARMGYLVIKKRLTAKVDKLEKKANDIFIGLWEESFVGVINADLLAVIVNAQAEAFKL